MLQLFREDKGVFQNAYLLLQDTTTMYMYTVVMSCNTIQTGFDIEVTKYFNNFSLQCSEYSNSSSTKETVGYKKHISFDYCYKDDVNSI